MIVHQLKQPSSVGEAKFVTDWSRLPHNAPRTFGQSPTDTEGSVVLVHADHWPDQTRLFNGVDQLQMRVQLIAAKSHSERWGAGEECVIPNIRARDGTAQVQVGNPLTDGRL